MDQEAFWEFVERVRRLVQDRYPLLAADQTCEHHADCLQRELQAFEPAELESFQDRLQTAVAEAYTSGLYAASYVVNGGGSLDGFYYFRAWLVFQGRMIHRRAIAEPDSLADVCIVRGIVADYECEDVLSVAKALYEGKTGRMMEWRPDPGDLGQDISGDPWTEEDLPKLLPRLVRIHMEERASPSLPRGEARPPQTYPYHRECQDSRRPPQKTTGTQNTWRSRALTTAERITSVSTERMEVDHEGSTWADRNRGRPGRGMSLHGRPRAGSPAG